MIGANPQATAATVPRTGGRMAVTARTLGIVGLDGGFLLLPLLAAVVAITMGSVGRQAVSAGRAEPETDRGFRTAIILGTVALVVWIPVVVAIAVVNA